MTPREFVHSRPFTAGFDSECGEGGDEIEAGDRVVMLDGQASHVACVDHEDCPEGGECE
jgi:hypothetical protein